MPLSHPIEPHVLTAVLSALSGPVVLCDEKGRILKVNPALECLVGRSERDLVGHPFWEAVLPGEAATAMQERCQDFRDKTVDLSPVEATFPGREGRPVTVLWSHNVLHEPSGGSTLILATGTDVTELRRLEKEATARDLSAASGRARAETLRKSEARFAGIVEVASDAIIAVDEEQRIVIFNQGAGTIFGYRPEEILGKPLDLLLPRRSRAAHRAHIQRFGDSPIVSRQMGQRSVIAGLRKGGEEFPAEASILKLDVDGRRLFTVVLRDISDRVRREAGQRFLAAIGEALSSSLEVEDTLRCIAERTVSEWADFCLIDLANGPGSSHRLEAAFRDPSQQALGEAFRSLCLDRSGPHLMSNVLETGAPVLVTEVTREHLVERSQGAAHFEWLQALAPRSYIAVPLQARGRTLGALLCGRTRQGGTAYDQEDLALGVELGSRAGIAVDNARLYREARDAVQARDDVLGVVSHDLGNPLQAIFIGLEALERERGSRGEGRAGSEEYYLSAIRRSADVMERLIRDLLEIRRMEAGHLTLEPAPQALLPLVEEALEVMDPLARVKSVEISNDLDPDELPEVTVDPDRIQQVLSNLVGNAVKHTPEGGRVTITGGSDGREIKISVRDTGPGIPAKDLEFVFDRFWRGSMGRGIGLGLAIAKGIVKAHGGEIWAESTPGEGSAFTFTLPLDPPTAEGGFTYVPAFSATPRP